MSSLRRSVAYMALDASRNGLWIFVRGKIPDNNRNSDGRVCGGHHQQT